jgi:glycosyltransferase involved in cell wall biosynthesis
VKVAYFSPMPPSTSGIADYSALLLPELRKLIDVEVISEPDGAAGRGKGCDLAVYHVGNNAEVHGWIVDELRRRPGLVVLHEHVLHHLIAGMTIVQGDREGYLNAMQRDAGVVGRLIAHGIIDGVVPPVWEKRAPDFPLTGTILDVATGVIAHSQAVEDAVRARGFLGPTYRIPHPAWLPPHVAVDAVMRDSPGPVFGSFGHLNSSKRIPQLVHAFERVLEQEPAARLLLVGSPSEDLFVEEPIDRMLAVYPDSIVRIPYVEEDRLWSLIAGCDVCVCLRYPTMGETSGIAIRALACGRPLIVSDVEWFSELPPSVALGVSPDGDEIANLASAMVELARDPTRREAMSVAAFGLARGDLAVTHVAELYRRAIIDQAGGELVRRRVVHDMGLAAHDVGVGLDSEAARTLRTDLRDSGL